jgi:hypothetical protein
LVMRDPDANCAMLFPTSRWLVAIVRCALMADTFVDTLIPTGTSICGQPYYLFGANRFLEHVVDVVLVSTGLLSSDHQ